MNRNLSETSSETSQDTRLGCRVLYGESGGVPEARARRRFFKRPSRRARPRCVPGCTAFERVSFALEARTMLSTLPVTSLAVSPVELRAEATFQTLVGSLPGGLDFRNGLLGSNGASNGSFNPSDIAMADLNGDGTPDLIVADGSSDRILIYSGLGGGQFGQPVRLTDGLPEGEGPAGLSVADLNGDGRLDLMVADKGADAVSIFMNTTRISGALGAVSPASPITFQSVATISAGPGPVSVVCGSYEGSGRYMAVGDSGTNSLMIFSMAADGTVDTEAPQVIALGHSPDLLVPLPGTGPATMAVVDSSDSTISLVTGIGDADPQVQTVSSGGLGPVAAQSFTSGKSSGLIVENGGDGSIAMFVQGPRGLMMTSKFSSPSLISSSITSLSNIHDLGSLVFASGSSSTSTLLGFVSTGPTITSVPKAQVTVTTQQLQSLHPSDVTIVSTLLPVSIEAAPLPAPLATASLVQASSPAVSVSVAAPGVNQPGRGNGAEKDGALSTGDGGGEMLTQTESPALGSAAPWEKYISGVDEAMEQLHQETIERQSRSPSAVEARAAAPAAGDIQVAARALSSTFEGKRAIALHKPVKESALFESAALGSIGVLFGPPSSPIDIAAESGLAPSNPVKARSVDRSEGLSSSGNEGGGSRSIAVSALLTVAVISPGAALRWLRTRTTTRRGGRPGRAKT